MIQLHPFQGRQDNHQTRWVARHAARFAIVATAVACAVGVSDSSLVDAVHLNTTNYADNQHLLVIRYRFLLAQLVGVHAQLFCGAVAFFCSVAPALRSELALFCLQGAAIALAIGRTVLLHVICCVAEDMKTNSHVRDDIRFLGNRQFFISLLAVVVHAASLFTSLAADK